MMRLWIFFIIAVSAILNLLTGHATVATLPPPERHYNILMLLPLSSLSHHSVVLPLATELTKRGHEVTILANYPKASNIGQNITYIQPCTTHPGIEGINAFTTMADRLLLMREYSVNISMFARNFYKVDGVQELYQRRDQFDLIIVDTMFNEVSFPFTYKKAFITVASAGLEPMRSATLGNILNPAYVSTNVLTPYPMPMGFVGRFMNILMSITVALSYKYFMINRKVQIEISKHFPELPSSDEMERNQSLVLLNSHFSLMTPLPLLPGQIEVGGMHCRPGEPLPKDINDFLSGRVPVIYFSLGTNARGSALPQPIQEVFIAAFAKLPYKVIWKFEEERQDLPSNVMIREWVPQQDILAHPNVAVFISHCGLLSMQEAIYHTTPVLALPILHDQPRNAQRLEEKGLGKVLKWEDLTQEIIIETLKELVTNQSYKSEVSRLSAIWKDQPQPPVERAVFWTEYVIRHAGAVHLRSPERDLSWVEVLHLDILLALHLALFLWLWSIKKILNFCFRSSASQKTNKKKRE